MKGKNILVTAACVIGFGGIIGNTLVGVATSRELRTRINNVEKNAKAADEAYNKSTVTELKRLINEANDSIHDTYDASIATLNSSVEAAIAKINQAMDALKAEMNEEMDSKDAALRTQLVNQLNNLTQSLATTLSSLGNDVAALDAAQQQLATAVEDIQGRVEELEETLDEVVDVVGEIIDAVVGISNFIETLDAKLTATATALQNLQANLESNYYTVSEMNVYLNAVITSLNTLRSYFLVGGDVKTMTQVVEQMETLGTDMSAFNGQEATDAKAQYVEELFAIISAYDHDVQHTYDQIVTAYSVQGLAVPGSITTLKDSLLASSGLADLKDKMMVAMTRIILAPTKEDAKAIRDLYAGNVEYEIDALRFELDRINASNAIFTLKTTASVYNFGDAEFAYFNDVMTYAFDNTDPAITDKAQYYKDAKADLAFRVKQAQGLSELLVKLNARNAAIAAFNDGVRLTDGATVAPYIAIIDELANIATYVNAIEEVDATSGELVLDTAEKIAAYVDAVDADASIVEYAADKYETLLQQENASDTVVAAFDNTVLADSVKAEITAAIALAVKDTDYQAALAAARGDDTLETVEARKAAIDEYIAKKVADCKYEQACAQYLFDIKTAANTADADIDALTNLTDEQKAVLKANYAAANVPALADLYTETGKGTADQYSTDEEWAALFDKNTADITAVKTIAVAQDAMKADEIAKLASLQTFSEQAGLPTDVVDLKAQFDGFVAAALANYTLVTDTEIVGLSADNGVLAIAAASADALADMKDATKLATDAYKDYIALVKAADDLNEHIIARMAGFESNFTATRYLYNQTDADQVLLDNAAAITSLKNDYTTAHGGANPTLPVYAFDGTATYAEQKQALDTFYAALAPAKQDVEDQTAAFDAAAAELEVAMAEEFDTKEAARLADNKASFKADLDAVYAKIIAKDLTSTQAAKALALYNGCVSDISEARRSNEPQVLYENTYSNFATMVFGFVDDANAGDPAYPDAKTAIQKLDAYLA